MLIEEDVDKIIDKSNKSDTSDRIGIFVSALCCIHCMALPFFVIFFPAIGNYFENEIIHTVTIALVVPIGLFSFITKIKVHKSKTPLIIGIIGMSLLLGTHLLHDIIPENISMYVEVGASLIGGLSLIAAHVVNVRLCHCNTCHH
jgi:predicted transporter